ncbi:MAG: MopE-related protein [Myxococcota bacterium]
MRTALALGSLALLPWSCSNDVKLDPTENTPPVVAFQAPLDQEAFEDIDTIDFIGSVADANGLSDIQSWTFSSDADGTIGEGTEVPDDGFVRVSRTLSVGTHSVTLTATDGDGGVGTDAITVIVTAADQTPDASIAIPGLYDAYELGTEVSLVGTVSDPNEPPEDLLVDWTVEPTSGTGAPIVLPNPGPDPAGLVSTSWLPEALGQYRARLVVSDSDGNSSDATVVFQIIDSDDIDRDGDGWSVNQGDCDDNNNQVHPQAEEICGNAIDDDCNLVVDDRDEDGDLHVDVVCAATYTGALPPDDCDDLDADVHPGAPEVADDVDNDCNGDIDEGTPHWDQDGDCVCPSPNVCYGSDNPLCSTFEVDDCDDDDAMNFPGNAEVCDGRDNDCDSAVDQGLPRQDWWPDADGDGYGSDSALPQNTCNGAPASHVSNNDDCDDGEFDVNPGVLEVDCDGIDNDCDAATIDGPDRDGDGSPVCGDCDDNDPNNFPGNPELCDGADNDCSGVPDDGIVFVSYFPDADGDGFGDGGGTETVACAPPPGTVADDTDCDDSDADVNPDALEIACDGIENDCDPATLDEPDLDGDGVSLCLDCNDGDANNFPGNTEACDNRDNNCNGAIDDGITFRDYYPDADLDGHGDPNGVPVNTCGTAPAGYALLADDCDDNDNHNFPGNPEVCDGADNDCDAVPDDGLVFVNWWPDLDGDGYGNAAAIPVRTCNGAPVGVPRVSNGDDCDDSRAAVNPAATEVTCDGIDNDCDVATADAPDQDGDGIPLCADCDDGDPANFPGNAEVCDGRDNDCDSAVDDGLTFADYWLDLDGDGYGTPLLPSVSTCDGAPAGRVGNNADCNDANSTINPSAPEITCDGIDNDCTAATLDQPDADGDGASMCVDCDDNDPLNRPGGAEICDGRDNDCDTLIDDGLTFVQYWPDADSDTFGSSTAPPVSTCNGPPAGHVSNALDCDDADGNNFPTNPEICDGRDNDCNGAIDNGLPFVDWYPDNDSDGYGSAQVPPTPSCNGRPSAGYLQDHTDCNDANGGIHPGAAEVPADAIDQDCDADDCYLDGDDDGVGVNVVISGTTLLCTGPGESRTSNDCDDADPLNWPGNVELCDRRDNDCDGAADEDQVFVITGPTPTATATATPRPRPSRPAPAPRPATSPTTATATTRARWCTRRDRGHLQQAQRRLRRGHPRRARRRRRRLPVCNDCNDADPNNFPGNVEVCDRRDNDCDAAVDEGLVFVTTWLDADADGWGDPGSASTATCSGIPSGRVDNDLDCDDSDATLNQDDLDLDGWSTCDGDCDDNDRSTYPTAPDVPDDLFTDEDCDGIDGNKASAVFVSTAGSDINNLVCSFLAPCRTLNYAQSVAAQLGLGQVYVRTGTYTGGVDLYDGMDLYGGYDTGWVRDDNTLTAHNVTIQGGYNATDFEYVTVRAYNVTGGLYDLQIDGPNASGTISRNGRSSYAVHADGADLVLERLEINQGAGAVGSIGTSSGNASQTAASNGGGGAARHLHQPLLDLAAGRGLARDQQRLRQHLGRRRRRRRLLRQLLLRGHLLVRVRQLQRQGRPGRQQRRRRGRRRRRRRPA